MDPAATSFNFSALLRMQTHKVKPSQFTSVAGGVKKRLETNIQTKRRTRFTNFDNFRNLSENEPVQEPLNKMAQRKLQLQKWKEEKEKRKAEALVNKKKPFVVGIPKTSKKFEPPPTVSWPLPSTSGRVTRSQAARSKITNNGNKEKQEMYTFAPQNASFNPTLKNLDKPSLSTFGKEKCDPHEKQSKIKNPNTVPNQETRSLRSRTKLTRNELNSQKKIIPKNKLAKQPQDTKTTNSKLILSSTASSSSDVDIPYSTEIVTKTTNSKLILSSTASSSSEVDIPYSTETGTKTTNSKLILSSTASSSSDVDIPDSTEIVTLKVKSIKKTKTSRTGGKSGNTTKNDDSILIKPTYSEKLVDLCSTSMETNTDEKPVHSPEKSIPNPAVTPNKQNATIQDFITFTPKNLIPKSESSSEQKLRSPNALDAVMTPQEIKEEVKKISPRVYLSRGKDNTRKEMKKKIEEGLLEEDNCDMTVEHFQRQLDSEIQRITEMCDEWDEMLERMTLPDEIQEAVLAAVGQARLLMSQKLQQFASLLHRSVNPEPGQALVTRADLQGFWDMVFLQVENVDIRFKKLEQLRARGWREEPAERAPRRCRLQAKQRPPAARPPAAGAATSRLKDIIAGKLEQLRARGWREEPAERAPRRCRLQAKQRPPAARPPAAGAATSRLKDIIAGKLEQLRARGWREEPAERAPRRCRLQAKQRPPAARPPAAGAATSRLKDIIAGKLEQLRARGWREEPAERAPRRCRLQAKQRPPAARPPAAGAATSRLKDIIAGKLEQLRARGWREEPAERAPRRCRLQAKQRPPAARPPAAGAATSRLKDIIAGKLEQLRARGWREEPAERAPRRCRLQAKQRPPAARPPAAGAATSRLKDIIAGKLEQLRARGWREEPAERAPRRCRLQAKQRPPAARPPAAGAATSRLKDIIAGKLEQLRARGWREEPAERAPRRCRLQAKQRPPAARPPAAGAATSRLKDIIAGKLEQLRARGWREEPAERAPRRCRLQAKQRPPAARPPAAGAATSRLKDIIAGKLEQLRARGWREEPAERAPRRCRLQAKQRPPAARPPAAGAATSRLKDIIAAARKAKQTNSDTTKTFEAGFFSVQSPVKSPAAATPPPRKPSLLQSVLSNEAKKASAKKSSYAMLRASLIGKSVDSREESPCEANVVPVTPINLGLTPGKSILKSNNNTSTKVASKISFKLFNMDTGSDSSPTSDDGQISGVEKLRDLDSSQNLSESSPAKLHDLDNLHSSDNLHSPESSDNPQKSASPLKFQNSQNMENVQNLQTSENPLNTEDNSIMKDTEKLVDGKGSRRSSRKKREIENNYFVSEDTEDERKENRRSSRKKRETLHNTEENSTTINTEEEKKRNRRSSRKKRESLHNAEDNVVTETTQEEKKENRRSSRKKRETLHNAEDNAVTMDIEEKEKENRQSSRKKRETLHNAEDNDVTETTQEEKKENRRSSRKKRETLHNAEENAVTMDIEEEEKENRQSSSKKRETNNNLMTMNTEKCEEEIESRQSSRRRPKLERQDAVEQVLTPAMTRSRRTTRQMPASENLENTKSSRRKKSLLEVNEEKLALTPTSTRSRRRV